MSTDYIQMNCPNCGASLSNYEQKERECFACQWNEAEDGNGLSATAPNAPKNFEYDREIDDDTQD